MSGADHFSDLLGDSVFMGRLWRELNPITARFLNLTPSRELTEGAQKGEYLARIRAIESLLRVSRKFYKTFYDTWIEVQVLQTILTMEYDLNTSPEHALACPIYRDEEIPADDVARDQRRADAWDAYMTKIAKQGRGEVPDEEYATWYYPHLDYEATLQANYGEMIKNPHDAPRDPHKGGGDLTSRPKHAFPPHEGHAYDFAMEKNYTTYVRGTPEELEEARRSIWGDLNWWFYRNAPPRAGLQEALGAAVLELPDRERVGTPWLRGQGDIGLEGFEGGSNEGIALMLEYRARYPEGDRGLLNLFTDEEVAALDPTPLQRLALLPRRTLGVMASLHAAAPDRYPAPPVALNEGVPRLVDDREWRDEPPTTDEELAATEAKHREYRAGLEARAAPEPRGLSGDT